MRIKSSLIGLIFVLTSFGSAIQANAQVVGQPYRLSDKEVEKILERIENQSKTFRRSLDDGLDRSRLNNTNREDDINAFIKNFNEQTKRLNDRFDDRKSVAADVETVLNSAASIDQFMRRQGLSERAQNDWSTLRASLDDLAAAYNVTWRWEGVAVAIGPTTVVTGTPVGLPYRLSDKEVEQILHRIEQQSGKFRSSLDSALDRSRLNDTNREDNINAFIKEFDQEVKRLHDRFDDRKSVTADVQSVLDRAARIDVFMRRRGLERAQDEWSALRENLDQLAAAYSVAWRW